MFEAKELGKKISDLRNQKHLKQDEFAEIMEVSQNTLSYYERGIRKPDAEFLYSLHEKFNIDLHWLITGESQPMAKPKDLLDETVLQQSIDISIEAGWIKILTEKTSSYIKDFTDTYEFLYGKKHKKP